MFLTCSAPVPVAWTPGFAGAAKNGLVCLHIPNSRAECGKHNTPQNRPDTTLAGYAGVETGQAGHGTEVSEHHVVIDQAFIRMASLIAGDPPPCNRDFQVEGAAASVVPDPAAVASGCPKGTVLGTSTPAVKLSVR